MLIYLAVEQDRPHRREALAGLLWPDWPEARARRILSQTLLNLRRTLGDAGDNAGDSPPNDPPFILITNQTLAFNCNSAQWTDVAAFESAMSKANYAKAVELYVDPFSMTLWSPKAISLNRGC